MSVKIEEEIGWGGGKLIADASGYTVQFYLAGPDQRYRGALFRIPKENISAMIDAYLRAFDRYEALKRFAPKGATMEERIGELNVRIGSFEGVCMNAYHNPIRSRSELDRVVSVLRRIRDTRGPELMAAAKALRQG